MKPLVFAYLVAAMMLLIFIQIGLFDIRERVLRIEQALRIHQGDK